MEVSNNSSTSITVVNGDSFLLTPDQPVAPVAGEANLSEANVLVMNSKLIYVQMVNGEPQLSQTACPTCMVVLDDGSGVQVSALNPSLVLNPAAAQQTQFTPEQIEQIRELVLENEEAKQALTQPENNEEDDEPVDSETEFSSASNTVLFAFVPYDHAAILAEAGYDTHGYPSNFTDLLGVDGIAVVNAIGGASASTSLTEGDLSVLAGDSGPGYPISTSVSVEVDAGTRPLDPTTFTFEPIQLQSLLTELNNEITSGGKPVEFSFDEGTNAIIGVLDGETIFSATISASTDNNRDVTVTVDVIVSGPLDHLNQGNNSGLVINANDQIDINLSIQGQDTNGNDLNDPISVEVTVNDGVDPSLGKDPGIILDELDDQGIPVHGQVPLDIGSDDIHLITIDTNQPLFEGLTSQSFPVTYVVDGQTLTAYNVVGEVVFTLEVQNDGSYTATLYRPFDQESSFESDYGITITALDKDGDTSPGTIHIKVNDAVLPTGGETGEVTIVEPDTDLSPYKVTGTTVVHVAPSVDKLEPGSVQFDPDQRVALLAELNADITTSDGRDIIFTFNADNNAIEGRTADGELALTIDINGIPLFLGVDVTVKVTQYLPLNHNTSGDQSGYVTVDGDQIKIDTQIQVHESDGTPLDTPVDVQVTISDGAPPAFSTDNGITIDELAQRDTVIHGAVPLDVGSDEIATLTFDATQSTFDGITSNGNPTHISISVDGMTLDLLDSHGDPVLTVVIDLDGKYTVTVSAPIDQLGSDDTSHFELNVTVVDNDGDSDTGIAVINVTDGLNASGSNATGDITLDILEGDLDTSANKSSYNPAVTDSGTFVIKASDDDLNPKSLYIDNTVWSGLQGELQSLTSGGEALTVTKTVGTDGLITITAMSGINTILTITFTPSEGDNGDVNVTMSITQSGPLDHQDGTDGDYISFVAKNGDAQDTIQITVPVQVKDTDGDSLTDASGSPDPVDVIVTINDGDDPKFTAVPSEPAKITESQEGNTVTPGDLVLDTGSDNIDALTFNLSDAQLAVLNALTSNGQDTSIDLSEDGVITVYIPAQFGGADIPVLVITLDNTKKDGSYTIDQHNPIDQPDSESINLDFNVVATDMDGDSDDAMISVTINDGANAHSDTVTAEISVTEGDLDNKGTSNAYPLPTFGSGSFNVVAVSDDLVAKSLTINDYAGFKASVEGMNLTSDGKPVTIDQNLVVNPATGVITITGMANGAIVFTLILTPTLQANGDVTVSMEIKQYASLDHPDTTDGANNLINITVPIQLQDTDGDYLVAADGTTNAPINVEVTFNDGADPSLGADSGVNFTEVDNGVDDAVHSGKIDIEVGSDRISSVQFDLTEAQKAVLDELTSNGQATEVEYADGQIIVYLSDGTAGYNPDSDTPILIITLDNNAKDGTYTVEQFESLDQLDGSDQTELSFGVTVTDKDGDTSDSKDITVTITDGSDPSFEADTSGITLNESDAGTAAGKQFGQVTMDVGSDVLTAEGITFQDKGNQPTSLSDLTSNGNPVDFTVSADGTTITFFDTTGTDPGNILLIINLSSDGSYDVEVLGPIDQSDSESTQIELNLTATDTDNDTANGSLIFTITDGDNAEGGQTGSISITEGTLSSSDPEAGYNPAITNSSGIISIDAGVERLNPTTVQIKPSDLSTLITELETDLTSGGQALVFKYDSVSGTLVGRVGSDTGAIVLTIVLTATQNGQGVDINVSMTQHLPLDHDQDSSGANSSGWVTVNDSEIHINLPIQVQDTDGDYLDKPVDVDLIIVDGTNPTFTVDSGVTVDESAINAGGKNHQGSNPDSDTETATGQINITLGSDEIANFKIDIEAFNTDGSLKSQGVVVELVDNNDGTFSGIAGGREVFTVTFTADGAYTFTIKGALDHNKATGNDTSLTIQLPIYAVDKDGDISESSNLIVTVIDDVPTVAGNTFDVNEGKTITASLLPSSEGADDLASISLSFADTENGDVSTPHESPFGLTDVYNGDQLLGQISVDSEGIVTFVSNPNLADVQESITLEMDIIVTDKDGDQDSGKITLNIHDQDPVFIIPDAHGQEEDGQTPDSDGSDNLDGSPHTETGIPVSLAIDLGDVDREEALVPGSLTITVPADADGAFYYGGAVIAIVDGEVVIPSVAITTDVNGMVTITGVTFVPDKDYSTDGITFTVNAEVSTNDTTTNQVITGDLTISVDGIADVPVWSAENVTSYTGDEDTAIAVGDLSAQRNDNDGSETLYYLVQLVDVSQGTLSGTGLVETFSGSGIYRIAANDIKNLAVTPDKDFSGDIHINAWAESQENAPYVDGKQTADTGAAMDIVVHVNPVADTDLSLKVTRVDSDEDTAINLQSLITLNHPSDNSDGSETLYVRFSNLPAGSQLLLNGEAVTLDENGQYQILYSNLDNLTFLPPPEASGDFKLTVEGVVIDIAILDSAETADEYVPDSTLPQPSLTHSTLP